MAEKTKLTAAGYKKLQDELYNLVQVVSEEVKVQLAEARAQGDLSENADYDAARNKQAEVDARIKEIEFILNNSEIITESGKNKNRVSLGSTVTLKNLSNGKTDTYMLVSSVEADPFNKKISIACPLGEAIVGKSVGDIIDIKSIKPYKVEVIKLENI
ncbi:MAG: transcription elongation factor GreA [Bacilli bacterium]|nr:transcription elongation factor GreA [Bacilli bacterium]